MASTNFDGAALTVRPEIPGDYDEIREVVAAAFGSEVEANLVERIRASPEYEPAMALVAVADIDGESVVVGHVMVSGAHIQVTDGRRRPIKMLSPLAVRPDLQRNGIGGALIRAVTAIADEQGEPFVILEGSPKYYPRFGFQPAFKYGLQLPLPAWAPPEAGQLLPLRSFDESDPELAGLALYPPAFDGLE